MSLPALSPWRHGGSHYPEAWYSHYGVELIDVMMLAITSAYRDCKKYSVAISAVFKGKHAQRALCCSSYWVRSTRDCCPARCQLISLPPLEYLVELREYGPVYSTWSALEGELAEPLEGVSACIGSCSAALEELTDDVTEDLLPVLREYILYSDSMKVSWLPPCAPGCLLYCQ